MNEFYVYMVRCKNGGLYTGYTKDLVKRMEEHRSGKGARYVRMYGYEEIVYSETHPSRSEAMRRERKIKSMPKAEKERLASS